MRRSSLCGAVLAVIILLPIAAPLAAADPGKDAGGARRAESRETVLSLTIKGGLIMIPIGICSVVVLTWTIERLISLRRRRVSPPGLLEAVFEALPARGRATQEDVAAARDACEASSSILGNVLRAAVEKIHRDETHAQASLEEAVAKEMHLLRRKLRPFEISVAVAPLLGLLGTIFGMISCFERATVADTAARAETLANGIYVALVTTAAGLCVAIPALLIHHYFSNRVDRIQDGIEEAATEFLDRYYGSAAAMRGAAVGAGT